MRRELLALASLLACSSARTPRSYGDSLRNTFKPNFGNADLEKLKAKVAADQAAKAAAAAEAAAPADAAPAPSARRSGLGAALACLAKRMPPSAVAAAAGAAWVVRSRRLLEREVTSELGVLRELLSAPRLEAPAAPAGRRELLAELRARRSLLSGHILPLLASLQEEAPRALAANTALELEALNATLTDRLSAATDLLAAYEALGQEAPPDFRAWPLNKLEERHVNLTTKWAELNEVLRLEARLGRTKMDWALPEWPADKLRSRARELTLKVSELSARREKDELLGKVEAELWRRGQKEVPVGLPLKTTEELRELLATLRGASGPAAPPPPDAPNAAALRRPAVKTAAGRGGAQRAAKKVNPYAASLAGGPKSSSDNKPKPSKKKGSKGRRG